MSLFSERNTAPMFMTPISIENIQTQYSAPQGRNPLDFWWNQFQTIVTSDPLVGGNPNQPYRKFGARTYAHQDL